MHPARRFLIVFSAAAWISGAGLALAEGFRAGDKVEAYSSMTGRWERATVQSVDGARYFVHGEDPNLVNAYWGVTQGQIRALGATATPPKPAVQAPATTANLNPKPAGPGGSATAQGAKRPEGTAQYVKGADGQTHLRAIIGAGDEMPIGRWKLSAGGQSVLTGRTNNGDGTMTERHVWAGPEAAGSLSINADGTWVEVSPSGTRTQGRWRDLGENRVELQGYDSETWTASTWHGELNLVNAVGQYEYGRRH